MLNKMSWKSASDRQTEYLKDIAENSFTLLQEIRDMRDEITLLNNNILRLFYNSSISSSPSPTNVEGPTVGLVEENRKVSPCDRSCQTSNDDITETGESTDTKTKV